MDFLLCWIFAVWLYGMWLCRLVGRCQHFAGNCCFHLQSEGFWLLWRERDKDFEFHVHYFLPVQIQIKFGWRTIITNIQTKFKYFYSLLFRLLKNKFYRKLVTIVRDGMCSDWCAYALNCVFTLFVLYQECTQIKKWIVCFRLVPLCLV